MSAMLLASQPDESKSPGAGALPSPNQSLSIDEDAASGEKAIDAATEGVAVKDIAAAGPGLAPGRPPTFLGRKRPAADAEAQAIGAPQTPWYRTSLGALALVLSLMALLYFALKRWAPSIKMQDAGLVRVMSRTVVGPRQSLVLLRVGQRVVLVGVSPDRVDRVCEIADSEEVAAITAQAAAGHTRGEFSAWLDREAAEFVDADKANAKGIAGIESRSGSKSLSDLLQKLRTTKV